MDKMLHGWVVVAMTFVELVENLSEDVIGWSAVEEGHTRLHLSGIYTAEDFTSRLVIMLKKGAVISRRRAPRTGWAK